MICPSCSTDNIAGLDHCESCGVDLSPFDGSDAESTSKAADLSHSVIRRPISDVETPPMLTVEPTTPISDLIDRMAAVEASCALVVYEGEALIGMVSERDILTKVAHRFDEAADSPVSEIMTPSPDTLPPDATIAWALNRMDLGGFRHLPIEKDERPTGVVSVKHLLRFLIDHYATQRV